MREYGRVVSGAKVSEAERRWLRVLGTLNEAQARLLVAEKALELGRGGISRLSELTGMSRVTIYKGAEQLRSGGRLRVVDEGRIGRVGAGRKRLAEVHPAIESELTRIVEETTAGDPMSLLKWTSKSTRTIAEELTRRGYPMSAVTVGRYLHELDYSLQAKVKAIEGPQHPDRDAQFRYINTEVKSFLRTGEPIISVDAKKKELVGAFKNAGRRWMPKSAPTPVMTHDFPQLGSGKAIPYGAYEVAQDRALVNVGVTHDTAEFAVESIGRWWRWLGRKAYPKASRLLICADAGGRNGNRLRAWKLHLQSLANQVGMPITVSHYPPGTSKWNKIEHRLFSFISMNWRGVPLVSFETVVNLIGSTKTRSGLKVKALLDIKDYATGAQITPSQMRDLNLRGHAFRPDWNYTLSPVKAA